MELKSEETFLGFCLFTLLQIYYYLQIYRRKLIIIQWLY